MTESSSNNNEEAPAAFAGLIPLIRQEWPQVPRAALEDAADSFDELVRVIADKTEHTKALVGKQLNELKALHDSREAKNGFLNDGELRKLRELLERLQFKSDDVTGYVRERLAEDARTQVKQNPLVTLMMAIGLGFILGFIFRGPGRR